MAIIVDQAIVLRLSDYSETSQIATLFTADHGQVRLLAKGARRATKLRVALGLEPLERGRGSFLLARGEAGLGTLAEWVQEDAHLGLRRSEPQLYAGLYVAERLATLTVEHDADAGLFHATALTLAALAEPEADWPRALARYQRLLLHASGHLPNLAGCVACGRARPPGRAAYFSLRAGGLVCRDCEPHYFDRTTLPAALLDSTPADGPAAAWLALLDDCLTHVAGRPASASMFLREAAASGAG